MHSLHHCLRSPWRMVVMHVNLHALHEDARQKCAGSLIQRIPAWLRTFTSMQSCVGETRLSVLLMMQKMQKKYAPRLFQTTYKMDQSLLHSRKRERGTSLTLTVSIHTRRQSKLLSYEHDRFDDWTLRDIGLSLCIGWQRVFGHFLLLRTEDLSRWWRQVVLNTTYPHAWLCHVMYDSFLHTHTTTLRRC